MLVAPSRHPLHKKRTGFDIIYFMKRKTELLALDAPEKTVLKPLEISQEDLKRLEVSIMGYKFIGFGNALVCPTCGAQQGIIIDRNPDETFKFYLRFCCICYQPSKKSTK